MTNIAVFASGTGSNAVNIVKSFNSGSRIRVALCLTDRENAPVIDKMKELGVETLYFPAVCGVKIRRRFSTSYAAMISR